MAAQLQRRRAQASSFMANKSASYMFRHRQLALIAKAMTAAAIAALRLSARPAIGILTSRSHSAS